MSLMTALRRSDPVQESKFAWSDAGRGPYRYARLKSSGVEYAIMRSPLSDPADYRPREGELLVSMKHTELIDGKEWATNAVHLAIPVAAGTIDAAEAKQKRQTAERPMRAWSALTDLLVPKRARPPMVLGKVPSDPNVGAMQAEFGIGGPLLLERDEPTLTPTPAGILAYHAEKYGAGTLSVQRGRLWYEGARPLTQADAALYLRLEDQLVGELTAQPVQCARCDQPAVTIVQPAAPACGACAQ